MRSIFRNSCFGSSLTLLLALLSGPGLAHENHAEHSADAGLLRSEHHYSLPELRVTRADGRRMSFLDAIEDSRPVMLNLIYTSCTAVCPVTSQVFMQVRERLGAERDKLNMVSFSIDPEQDTPQLLTEYAYRFGSAGVWPHYTSSSAAAVEIQRAFGGWRGNKKNHQSTTYLRIARDKPRLRLDGFYSPTALVAEYQKALLVQVPVRRSESARNAAAASPNADLAAVITVKCTTSKNSSGCLAAWPSLLAFWLRMSIRRPDGRLPEKSGRAGFTAN